MRIFVVISYIVEPSWETYSNIVFIVVPSHKPEVKFEDKLSRKHDSFSFQECLIVPIRKTGPASAFGDSSQAVFIS